MRRLIVLAALALCGCGGSEKEPGTPTLTPDVAGNFSQPLDARGAAPAWGLKIRGQQLTLDRPNQPDLVGVAPGASIQPHAAEWTARLPDGRTMKVSLYVSPCADATTGVNYPFAAEVLLPDSTPLDGCAGRPAGAPATAKR